jgi:signal transduction histidine kinase
MGFDVLSALAGAFAMAAIAVSASRWLRARAARREADGRDRTAMVGTLLEELRARDTVFAAMGEGVLLFDPAGQLAYANGASQTILERRFARVDDVVPLELRRAIHDAQGLAGDAGVQAPARHQFETAAAVVEATALPAGAPGTVVVVLRDVTEARDVERLRRDFVANASHELKTPVASILALSTSLRTAATDDPATVSRLLPQLETQADRLATLVGDLLLLSRLEGRAPERRRVRIDELVEVESARLQSRAAAGGLRWRIDAETPLSVFGSQPDLAVMVHNLLDNAISYTPDGGEVRATLHDVAGRAQLTVEDTGIGIPPDDLSRIFERFYRVDAARSRRTGGTGLGLSIVRHVAESHGGEVHVRSTLGEGSSFVIGLPLLDA